MGVAWLSGRGIPSSEKLLPLLLVYWPKEVELVEVKGGEKAPYW